MKIAIVASLKYASEVGLFGKDYAFVTDDGAVPNKFGSAKVFLCNTHGQVEPPVRLEKGVSVVWARTGHDARALVDKARTPIVLLISTSFEVSVQSYPDRVRVIRVGAGSQVHEIDIDKEISQVSHSRSTWDGDFTPVEAMAALVSETEELGLYSDEFDIIEELEEVPEGPSSEE